MIHKIQANSSGSKFIEVSDEHLKTIQKFYYRFAGELLKTG